MNNLIKQARFILKHFPRSTKHITFIMRRTTPICWGINKTWKTSPLANQFGHRSDCIHSELDAIKNFPYPVKELKNYDIVNIRILANGNVSMSKPCINCRKMLKYFGIKSIKYTTFGGETEELIL